MDVSNERLQLKQNALSAAMKIFCYSQSKTHKNSLSMPRLTLCLITYSHKSFNKLIFTCEILYYSIAFCIEYVKYIFFVDAGKNILK